MNILISYDISIKNNGQKRSNKIYKICKKYGYKVQKSVFICNLNNKELNFLRREINDIIDNKLDSCFFIKTKEYTYIGNNFTPKMKNIL